MLKTVPIFLAIVLQFLIAATALARSPFDDYEPTFAKPWQCESYSLVPTQQSQEGEQSSEQEEEEPDCE